MKRAISPPDAMRSSGPGAAPGLVETRNRVASPPDGPQSFLRQRLDLRDELRLVEFERRQFLRDQPVEFFGGGAALRCGLGGASVEGFSRGDDFSFQVGENFFLPLRECDTRRQPFAHGGKIVHRALMLARFAAQGEQAIVDVGQAVITVLKIGGQALDLCGELPDFGSGPAQRFDNGAAVVTKFFDRAPDAAERGFHRADARVRLAQIFQPLRALQQALTQGGESLFLIRLGIQGFKRVERGAQIIFFRAGAAGLVGGGLQGGARRRPAMPCIREAGGIDIGVGVQQGAMRAGVEQALCIELAMDFDEQRTDLSQQAGADRLVVDEGAAAAVGAEGTAEDEDGIGGSIIGVRGGVERLLAQKDARRVAAFDLEFRGDGCLRLALAHEAGFSPAAEGKTERVEQYRFARARFPGQRAKAGGEFHRQPVDQDHVRDGQGLQHGF